MSWQLRAQYFKGGRGLGLVDNASNCYEATCIEGQEAGEGLYNKGGVAQTKSHIGGSNFVLPKSKKEISEINNAFLR